MNLPRPTATSEAGADGHFHNRPAVDPKVSDTPVTCQGKACEVHEPFFEIQRNPLDGHVPPHLIAAVVGADVNIARPIIDAALLFSIRASAGQFHFPAIYA
ncbi:hypothetical protein [Pelomonas sp. Root1444]|uniref:hypothetical protein n=1 Tax=Pelomonas sp. Root1444 TaxID=1736464 RepID=UPI0012F8796C|nr:hypothetical protein [Pelomonas sp. Root1444]